MVDGRDFDVRYGIGMRSVLRREVDGDVSLRRQR